METDQRTGGKPHLARVLRFLYPSARTRRYIGQKDRFESGDGYGGERRHEQARGQAPRGDRKMRPRRERFPPVRGRQRRFHARRGRGRVRIVSPFPYQ